MAELSVVVPIYRVEPYLKKCVDSILRQCVVDMELILVDDGSPDGCPQICDAYANADARVRVIHQANQGSVRARRAGLLAACGEYVTFVDGDDWLAGEMYAPMLALARKHHADVVISGYRQGNEQTYALKRNVIDSGVYRGAELRKLKDRALYSGVYYEPGIVAALWNKLIRRDLLLSLGDAAPAEAKMGDDAAVTYPLLLAASCVVVQNELQTYHYRETGGSMSRSPDRQYFDRLYALINSLEEHLADDAGMLRQLDYYALFVLEIGFCQMIAVHRQLFKTCRVISQQIARFAVAERIGRIDKRTLDRRARARMRMLRGNCPGAYILLWIADGVLAKLGI